ncbi:MAG: prepilin-type N-terminal cleavage/methylation domain-containing protein [Polyangiaceae bacterium]|nr:prepilin-type N-terminal cleavage/methylation domain-containing protein [Polyangiaceae bacterium]
MSVRATGRRGYTAVELLMAISIFAIGVSGIIAMQKVTVGANKHARDLAIATHIAQAWLEQLSADAAAWNHPSPKATTSDLNQTTWLQQVGAGWVRPAYSGARVFGAGFDALGNPVSDANPGDAVFCAHIRLSWLYPEASGNGLIRTEVRVFWLRDGQGAPIGNQPVCAPATAPAAVEGAGLKYHFVHQASAAKQNTAP